jgi:hypothetical protein
MIVAEIHFSLLGGVVVAALFAAAGAAAAWLSYRKTVPPLPPGRRAFLTALRVLTLAAIALLLAEPVVQFIDARTDPPVVAVLLDNTQSVPVAGKDAGEGMRAFLAASAGSAPAGASLRYFPFAGAVTGALDAPPESLSFGGQSTNLSAALAEVRKRAGEENIQAVVLASDGNYNEGRNPLNELEGLALPVFAAGAGDTLRQKDLVVDRVFTNTIAYAGSMVPVEAYLRSFGYAGRRVEVVIGRGNEVLGRAPVALDAARTEYPVRFSIPAGEEGVHKFVVSVGALPGELTNANNSQTFFLRVLRSRIRVALFAGAPFPDVAALRQAVAEDPQMEIASYVQKSPGAFTPAEPPQAAIDSADCIVFCAFPSSLTSDAFIGRLLASMRKSRKPLLYVHGRSADAARLRSFDEFLPFTFSGVNPAEEAVFAAVPEGMRTHPLVADERGGITPDSWDRLPPVFKVRTAFQARPGSEVLAYARISTVTTNEPLVLTRSVGGVKSFAVTGHGIYRWRLLSQGSPATEKFFPALVSGAVRWLTTRENQKPVRVSPLKEIFTTAEGVGFRAEVYDEQLRPVDNAEVVVRYSAPGRDQFDMALGPIGNGRYEGSDGPVPAGDYGYRASAKSGGRDLGTDAGKFSVGPVNVEYLATSMNRPLLEQIAGQSGGGYHPLADGDRLWKDLAAKVKLAPREEVTRREIELWNFGWLGGILILLLAVEWFLRKRWALL